jgi:phage repressor protein C with HTH and peptisase S24 domain
MEDYRMVKYLRRHSDNDKVILHSANPDYDDMEVSRKDIIGLYLVEAILNYDIRC